MKNYSTRTQTNYWSNFNTLQVNWVQISKSCNWVKVLRAVKTFTHPLEAITVESHNIALFCRSPWCYFNSTISAYLTVKSCFVKEQEVWALKCLWNETLFVLIWKAFRIAEERRFSFWNIFFHLRDFDIFLLCKLDHWWRHTVCN